MKWRAETERIAREHGIEIDLTPPGGSFDSRDDASLLELLAPEGKLFWGGLTGLLCCGWQDAYTRLKEHLPLEDDPADVEKVERDNVANSPSGRSWDKRRFRCR